MVPDRHQLLDRPFVVPQPSQPFLQRCLAVQETASDVGKNAVPQMLGKKCNASDVGKNAMPLMLKKCNSSDIGETQCI